MVWGIIVLQFIAILFILRPNFCSHNVNFTRDLCYSIRGNISFSF